VLKKREDLNMSDDLVKRLRYWAGFGYGVEASATMNAAAVRIEQLEVALREVINCWDWWQVDTHDRCASVPSDAVREARAALGEKKDEQN
jgi:hypothetical protein